MAKHSHFFLNNWLCYHNSGPYIGIVLISSSIHNYTHWVPGIWSSYREVFRTSFHYIKRTRLQAGSEGQGMREVEPALVTALDFSISNDGTSNTCARVELQLTDPTSPLLGCTFHLELPPPNCGHAEFVIPRHRFLTSIQRRWACPDECQVCLAWQHSATHCLCCELSQPQDIVLNACLSIALTCAW